MAYVYPTNTSNVSDSFNDHVNRRSVNPGTDYTSGMGSPVFSVADGRIQVADTSPAGGGGRCMNIAHDDGTGADYLHLSRLVVLGGRVSKGQLIAYTGASGFNDDRYYGAHLHLSFRRNHSASFSNVGNVDFHALMQGQPSTPAGGGGIPITLEDDMIRIQSPARGIALIGPGYYRHLTSTEEVQQSDPIITKHLNGNDRQFDLWKSMALYGQATKPI